MYALVLAGGRGERLRPLTDDRPKPMVPVAGAPLLEYHLRWLRSQGVSHAVLLCGYMAQAIREHFGDGRHLGLTIHYSVEETPLGRGGAFKRGFRLVPPGEEMVIATNGDIITDQPLGPLIRAHRRRNAVATVMLTPLVSPYGIVRVERDGRVRRFDEKPRLNHWINAGAYILSRAFFDLLPDVGDHEDTTFPLLAQQGRLFAYRSRAFWKSVETSKDLTELAQRLPTLAFGRRQQEAP